MSKEKEFIVGKHEVQQVNSALDSGLGENSNVAGINEARMTSPTAPVSPVKQQGLNTQIKAWAASLPISEKQIIELLRVKRDSKGNLMDSRITDNIKATLLIPKVAHTVERQRAGITVTPSSEPFVPQHPLPQDEFKLLIDVGKPKP